MAEVKVSRESSGQQQQRTGQQQSGQVQTQRQGGLSRREGYPGIFSVSPREFFSLSPFEMVRRFTDEMDRFFGGSPHEGIENAYWSPNLEVREQDNRLIVSADLPGLNKEDVKVEVTNEGLAIQGERRQEQEQRQGGVYRSERSYGRFYRLIPLPEGAETDKAKADFKNGVLQVQVPLSQQQKQRSRQIPING